MSYRVVWSRRAEEELTRAWLASRRRQAMTEAADRLDALLRERPLDVGESRVAGVRLALETPLGIRFQVDTERRAVLVTAVWEY